VAGGSNLEEKAEVFYANQDRDQRTRTDRASLSASMLQGKEGELEIAAINDLTEPKINAHLFKYDSTYGPFSGEVEVDEGVIMIDGRRVAAYSESDPAKIPWKKEGVQIVVESTGRFADSGKPPSTSRPEQRR
jgi:glyceraldehyde 3-phosphate dehydrogenase